MNFTVNVTPLLLALEGILVPIVLGFIVNMAWKEVQPYVVKYLGAKNALILQDRFSALATHAIGYAVQAGGDRIARDGGITIDTRNIMVSWATQYASDHAADLAQDAGKKAKLSGRAAGLAGEAGLRESALGDGAFDDGVLGGLDIGRDRLEELGALLGGRGSVVGEGRGGSRAGGIDVGRVAIGVGGLELLACGGVEGADLFSGTPNRFTGNEHLSRQVSVGHRGSHVVLGL